MANYKDHEHYGVCKYCKQYPASSIIKDPCNICYPHISRPSWQPAEPERYCQDCVYYEILDCGASPCRECHDHNCHIRKGKLSSEPYERYKADVERVLAEAWERHKRELKEKADASEIACWTCEKSCKPMGSIIENYVNGLMGMTDGVGELTKQLEEMHKAHKKHVAEMQDKYRKTWAIDARFKKNEAWWHADISEEPSWGKSVTRILEQETKKLHGAGELIIMPVAYFVDQITMDEDTKEVEITFKNGTRVNVSMPKIKPESDLTS